MRKLPASEQPTQLTVREVTDPLVTRSKRRFSSMTWVIAFMVVMSICVVAGFGGALLARQIYFSLDPEADDITYEVVERKEPVTVASTTGEAIAKAPLSPLFTPEVQFWAPLIAEWAVAWEIDPNLIATVIQIESCGNPLISSGAGAQGLFQVMPFHFDPGEDMLDVQNNARRGLSYLNAGLIRSEGHAGLALAGYNGGHSVIDKGYGAWYSETRRYYYWGAGIYADAIAGKQSSTRLQEWLAAGGQSLCATAATAQETIDVSELYQTRS